MLTSARHKFVSAKLDAADATKVRPSNWNADHTVLSHARADIPSLTITQDTFYVSGFYTPGDIGAGALYTSVGATSTGLMAIQDAAGTWFNLVVNDYVDVGWVGFLNDGVFDNLAVSEAFRFGPLKTLGPPGIKNTVTIDIANPAVIHWTKHELRVNDAIRFSSTGLLPTGIVSGTTYYVLPTGLTRDQFQISDHNPFPFMFTIDKGFGAAVITTGSQSGVHSAQLLGGEWITINIPPGYYFCSASSQTIQFDSNRRKTRIIGYGAIINAAVGGQSLSESYSGIFGYSAPIHNVPINFASVNQVITLKNISDNTMFDVGGWICVGALDLQNSFGTLTSYPPNSHYNEFARILDINRSTGDITLNWNLRNYYSYSYPQFWGGNDASIGQNAFASHGGPAMLIPMNSDWDSEWELRGVRLYNAGSANGTPARRIKIADCSFDADGLIPSVVKEQTYENCQWNVANIANRNPGFGNQYIEVDKLIEELRFTECSWSQLLVQSSSVDHLVVDKCMGVSIFGLARNTHIKDTTITRLTLGVGIGSCENAIIENCRIPIITDFQAAFGWFSAAAHRFTFNSGVLSRPMTEAGGAVSAWAVPGQNLFVRSLKNAIDQSLIINRGSPFTVLDVTESGTPNATVTITSGNPTVVNWAGHGLAAGTIVCFRFIPGGGTLPTGLYLATPYYVLAAGLAADSFRISTTDGGSPVVSSGSSTGTITALANPSFDIRTTLTAMPVSDMTSSVVTISIGSPAVISWAVHGLTADTPVAFTTTGALPTGLNPDTLYYVLAAGLTGGTFEVSTSPGGAPVNTSGVQSGTQKAWANPIYFQKQSVPRLTVRNCTGGRAAVDLGKTPEGLPPWSYSSTRLIGNPVLQVQLGDTWGKVTFITINVLRADTTGSGATLGLTCVGFDANLLPSNFSATIDVSQVGLRTITQAAATGSVGADSIAAYTGWLASVMRMVYSVGIFGTFSQQPIVEVTVQTDQGYCVSRVIDYAVYDNPVLLADDNLSMNPSSGG